MQIVFGIDFGTTNSALSVYRNGTVEVLAVDGNGGAGELMRSVLYFSEENEIYAGHEAISHYVSDGAAGRFMQSIKTFLPNTSFDSTEIFGKRYMIDDLVAIILRKLKASGEAHVGCPVDSVVLGRPVVFSTDAAKDAVAEKRLEKAARKAGFKNIWFQYEPVAAALAFESTLQAGQERTVFIGDFGGGTSDFSVIRVKGGDFARSDRRSDVLSLGGVYVAGDKFDSQIMWDKVAHHFGRYARYKTMGKEEWVSIPKSIIYTLCQWHRIPLLRARKTRELIRVIKGTTDDCRALEHLENIISDNYGFFLFQAIEKAKCELSDRDRALISFTERDLCISEDLGKGEFEMLNAENFQQITTCIDGVIAGSGLLSAQIDTVFLTGGTSRIPHIQALFAERFGLDKLEKRDAFTSVVHGLGASVPLYI
ncbi:MAG: Hsp70 family protein [Desulfuromonadaceae bacterium]|nr:Hsp70 family protein [Desulfuromonadaceae bacterium]MDD2849111.1 Hsp70 family protein [Desulfuromonadaceae bacterium]MDD4129479.1 Hsp70 family protein [Desulfuromonadaceae bacterium]